MGAILFGTFGLPNFLLIVIALTFNGSMELEMSIEGERQLSRRIEGIAKDCKDFSPEFKDVGSYLVGFFSGEVFDSRGAVYGEAWKKRKKEYPWPLLEKTGEMRYAFKDKVEKMGVAVFNPVMYFKFHQSKMPRRKLPRRIMMKLDEMRKSMIVQIFHRGIWNRLTKKRL